MSISIIAASFAVPMLQGWSLSAPFQKDSLTEWGVSLRVSAQGQDLGVSMTLSYKVAEKSEKALAGSITFKDLEVEGESPPDPPTAQLSLGLRGHSLSTTSEFGDDFRRMMIPFFIPYPESPIAPSDSWKYEYQPSGAAKVTYTAKAVGVEQIDGKETLKVTMKVEEEGATGLKSDGTYWIRKDGKVAKFGLKS